MLHANAPAKPNIDGVNAADIDNCEVPGDRLRVWTQRPLMTKMNFCAEFLQSNVLEIRAIPPLSPNCG
jgi:hypothetical protein